MLQNTKYCKDPGFTSHEQLTNDSTNLMKNVVLKFVTPQFK